MTSVIRRLQEWLQTFLSNPRRKRVLPVLAALLVLVLSSYYYYPDHVHAVGLLVRNRFVNQAFRLAPELSPGDRSNASLLLYWTPFFENTAFSGFGRRPFAKCPVNNCVATNNRSYLREARAVLFHGADMSMYDLPADRQPHQLYMYYGHEAPPQLPMPLGALNNVFNVTITYRRDSDVHMPYQRMVRHNDTGTATTARPSQPAAGPAGDPGVAWVVSHCHTDGHREDYVAELRRYIAVNEYGSCSDRSCPVAGVLQCYQYLAAHSNVFYLAFENSLCRDYVTEKFFLALRAGLVPVARGATRAEYEAVAPPNSFIHVDDFAGPRELAAHLRWLAGNATALDQLREWRHHYRFAPRDSWCRICEIMWQELQPGSAVVADLHRWWYDGAQCHQ